MVERIRILLEARQLTPTQFADAIGIARPIVSHILSGRNKPSLEVVQRILTAMPDLSMAWLLNGSGPMLAMPQPEQETASRDANPVPQPSKQPTEQIAPVPASTQASAKASAGSVDKRFENKALPAEPRRATIGAAAPAFKRFTAKSTASDLRSRDGNEPMPHPYTAEPVALPIPGILAEDVKPEPNVAAQLIAKAEKPIRRIVIFYQDGSFADYKPE